MNSSNDNNYLVLPPAGPHDAEVSKAGAGQPQASSAGSADSASHAMFPKSVVAKSLGADEHSDGPPLASSAPSGGSVVREATSVGATSISIRGARTHNLKNIDLDIPQPAGGHHRPERVRQVLACL